ncbi:UNVERIFIED_CONTAM: hypothetical protein GTU68_024012 [Idotea baltica]|nr:hypothetical protein [Idotea baltica]
MDFDVDDIDPFSCTHVVYSFAGLDNETLTIKALDEERDVIQGAYKSTVALKKRNPELKVLIAIGGWAEGGKTYSDMVSTQESRDAFVESVVTFMKEHRFDGLDLDWEYPGAPDRGGKHTDKENIALLTEELQPIFKENGWLLTMAVPVAKGLIDDGYDIPRLSQTLDFFNLMTYDLRGAWNGYADHHAPFAARSTDKYIHKGLNMIEGIQLFVDYGAPKYKLVIGVPFYGRSFILKNPENAEPGSRVGRNSSAGMAGKYTQENGYVAYFEICMNQRNGGWKVMRDEALGAYMSKDENWIGYDDEESIKQKVDFIKNERLGGVMFWAIDLDDYLGVCGTRWPLLSTIRTALHAPSDSEYTETITKSSSEIVVQTQTSMLNYFIFVFFTTVISGYLKCPVLVILLTEICKNDKRHLLLFGFSFYL